MYDHRGHHSLGTCIDAEQWFAGNDFMKIDLSLGFADDSKFFYLILNRYWWEWDGYCYRSHFSIGPTLFDF